jgi:LacI family transcriptional regulator
MSQKANEKASVSIKDVARAATVSSQTVSRALRRSGYVGPATRARIEAAVERLGYRPNANARALVQRTSDVVAIVLPSDVAMVVRNPSFGKVFAGITETVEREGFRVLLDISRGRRSFADVYLAAGRPGWC